MTKSQVKAKRRKKRRLLIATLAMAAVIVIAFTFAWYSSKDSVTNTFQTSGSFKTVVVENFVPPTDWEPGATTDKVVQITNTGTIDAYVRADFDYDMTFYMKDGNDEDGYELTEIGDQLNFSSNYYATVDPDAIKAAVKNAEFEEYIENTYGLGLKVPDGVTLYVKKSTGETTVESSTVVETEKYEFLAYYTDSDSNKTYEVDIAVDNTNLEDYGYGNNDGFIVVKGDEGSDVSSALKFSLYNTIKYTTDTDAESETNAVVLATIPTDPADGESEGVINDIFDVITLNFYNTEGNGELDTDNWYKHDVTDDNDSVIDTYYYYRNVLVSGATTPALLDSVTFNGEVPNITDLVFNLTVNMDSTQALVDAAVATFGETDAWVAQATNGSDKYSDTNYATTVLNNDQKKYADGNNTYIGTDNEEDPGSDDDVEQP